MNNLFFLGGGRGQKSVQGRKARERLKYTFKKPGGAFLPIYPPPLFLRVNGSNIRLSKLKKNILKDGFRSLQGGNYENL